MKKLILLLLMVFSLAFTDDVTAQVRTITGVVSAQSDGIALPGVNVLIKGTAKGTQTDYDGNYSIEAVKGDVLEFSFMGMKTQLITVQDSNTVNAVLEDDALSLDEVIVTALGIKKEKKALTYSAQEVKGDALTTVKQTNPINSLSGKSSGVTITKSSSGAGGSSKVVLRGNSSTTNNDPLYVVDGVPMLNSGNGQNGDGGNGIFGSDAGNVDGGDALSLINPDDIESLTVLKGASASALYGSQGANGVILITTKSGKDGKLSVNFNSSLTIDNVTSLPELQSEYQSNSVGEAVAINGNVTDPKSWGAKTSGLSNDYAKDFFETGFTSIQSLSLMAGNEKAQTYMSYANTAVNGVVPNNRLIRNNFNVKETASFFDNKINVTASVNLSDQRIWNRPVNGLYSNPLTGLYLNPVGVDLDAYKNYEYLNTDTNMMDQYATSFDENIQQNPYWLTGKNQTKDIAQRVVANVSAKYQITDNFSVQSRASLDKSFFTYDNRVYGGTDLTLSPATGRYMLNKTENTQQYIDLIANYSTDITEDFTLSAVLGTSLTKYKIGDQISLDSGNGKGLTYPNVFTIANFAETNNLSQSVVNREVQSIFASANLGYKNLLFLDVTGRNDWSSTLVNTDSHSFFYPSFGLTGILSEMFELPEAVTFAKLRASYAIVGKDIPAYATIPLNSIPTGQTNFGKPTFGVIEGETLEPEKQNSFEIGTEWRFINNRLSFDLTYYNTKTTNQIFYITAEPNVHGYVQNIVNAGEIENSGVELTVAGKPIVNDNFTWESTLNFATNNNKVIEVHPSLQDGEAIITAPGVNGYGYSLIEGEDFGSIRGRSVVRNEDGLAVVADDGAGGFSIQDTGFETIAHAQPDFTLGWSNSFYFGNFQVNFLIDGKFGGDVVSVTEAVNDFYGVSQATADARNTNGGMIDVVDVNGNAQQMTAQDYYLKTGGRAGMLGEYVYDATNVSLRELSVGYNLMLENTVIDNVRFSLIANNLFFIYKDAPFDPNIASSTGMGLQGVDIYGQPSTRSIGLNINVNF
ncbi:SusC/RagA family TonB-linked outer membrane protein [Lutibacter holmesii]|uniref:SusC/RagA family TonB-linked outer membrane protein n=1 Tax=Lutibacter holmesii TaxID=1137985 RepID=A0ABW3WKQ0_9FLAO